MHWKIERDSYYSELYPLLGQTGIAEAGFFYDTATENIPIKDSLNWLCTPFHFPEFDETVQPCVLLSTGAFCPIHAGHIEMMTIAKNTVEANGYQVLGGYLSPGHDEYISQKTGERAIPIQQRIALIQKAIEASAESDWLMLDPWEGLFCSVAVNFTDVIERLETYLEKHLGQKISVFYVCGGDNARFSLTFLQKGHCVIVSRPPYDERFYHYQNLLKENPRIFWANADNPLNSSEIRNHTDFTPSLPTNLHLRVEELDEREEELIELMRKYFDNLQLNYLSKQKETFRQVKKQPLLSLDSLLSDEYNLKISRYFDLFGLRQLRFGQRPNSPALNIQVENLSKLDAYYLFDDDTHSGQTLKFAEALLLEKGIGIIEKITLTQTASSFSETLDCRDFLIGGENNGLVICLGGRLLRVPYCYPYCCPFVRASIADSIGFSRAVWQLNADYFTQKGTLLKDLSETWQWLFMYIGFSLETGMDAVCHWHLERLYMSGENS